MGSAKRLGRVTGLVILMVTIGSNCAKPTDMCTKVSVTVLTHRCDAIQITGHSALTSTTGTLGLRLVRSQYLIRWPTAKWADFKVRNIVGDINSAVRQRTSPSRMNADSPTTHGGCGLQYRGSLFSVLSEGWLCFVLRLLSVGLFSLWLLWICRWEVTLSQNRRHVYLKTSSFLPRMNWKVEVSGLTDWMSPHDSSKANLPKRVWRSIESMAMRFRNLTWWQARNSVNRIPCNWLAPRERRSSWRSAKTSKSVRSEGAVPSAVRLSSVDMGSKPRTITTTTLKESTSKEKFWSSCGVILVRLMRKVRSGQLTAFRNMPISVPKWVTWQLTRRLPSCSWTTLMQEKRLQRLERKVWPKRMKRWRLQQKNFWRSRWRRLKKRPQPAANWPKRQTSRSRCDRR